MKALLILLAISINYAATAQWGSRLKRQKTVADIQYTIDTFRYKDDIVPIQRYQRADLMTVIGNNAAENRVALAIDKLQEQLISMHTYLLRGREINFIDVGERYLADIRRENTGYNYSCLQAEYELYRKYKDVQTLAEKDAERQQWIREIQTLAAEDPNTITPYDTELATKYKGPYENAPGAAKAVEKIARIQREQAQAREDSAQMLQDARQELETIMQQAQDEIDQKAFEKDCIKKYGVTNGKAIASGNVLLGMTRQMCLLAWGEPFDTRKTTTEGKITERWLYAPGRSLVFRNGVLKTINE